MNILAFGISCDTVATRININLNRPPWKHYLLVVEASLVGCWDQVEDYYTIEKVETKWILD